MTHLFGVFLAGYASVFLLGFQSRLVNHGNFIGAACCSFCIALAQAGIWKELTAPEATWADTVTYGLSGACAITSAMWTHKRFFMGQRNG
jgi:hypothetical protein